MKCDTISELPVIEFDRQCAVGHKVEQERNAALLLLLLDRLQVCATRVKLDLIPELG
jgi:hypothetical protein